VAQFEKFQGIVIPERGIAQGICFFAAGSEQIPQR
jgi:hypothetical protein